MRKKNFKKKIIKINIKLDALIFGAERTHVMDSRKKMAPITTQEARPSRCAVATIFFLLFF